MTEDSYVVPSSAEMAATQDDTPALRLLLAQRRIYKRAKWWAALQRGGLGVVAVSAPIIAAIWTDAAVAVGAVAGVWIFLSRTVFITAEQWHTHRGAVVQETFDQLVFGMPPGESDRRPHISPEDLFRLIGDEAKFERAVTAERLRGWYPFDQSLPGDASVAIAQRANAAYADRLLRSSAWSWLAATVAWAIVAVVIGLLRHLSLSTFLLGVAFPVLPALLDVFDQWRSTRAASKIRSGLAKVIEDHLRQPPNAEESEQKLLVWQEQLYALRRDAPQVPTMVYFGTRKKNERDMKRAAESLAADVRRVRDANGGSRSG